MTLKTFHRACSEGTRPYFGLRVAILDAILKEVDLDMFNTGILRVLRECVTKLCTFVNNSSCIADGSPSFKL